MHTVQCTYNRFWSLVYGETLISTVRYPYGIHIMDTDGIYISGTNSVRTNLVRSKLHIYIYPIGA